MHVLDVMYQTSLDIIKEKKKALMSSDPAVVAEMASKKDIISILSAYHLNYPIYNLLTLSFVSESQHASV